MQFFKSSCLVSLFTLAIYIPHLTASSKPVAQVNSKLVAEGDYGVRSSTGTPIPKSHWVMSQTSDGSLEVTIRQSMDKRKWTQQFRFTSEFRPTGYSLEQESNSELTRLSCVMAKDAITCKSEFHGHKSSARLKMDKPYVFISTEFTTDYFWLSTGTMSQVSREPGRVTQVAVVTLAEAQNDEIALEVAEVDNVKYIGRKEFKSVFGSVECNVFQTDSGQMFVADSGVIIAIAPHDAEGSMELVGLKDDNHRVLKANAGTSGTPQTP